MGAAKGLLTLMLKAKAVHVEKDTTLVFLRIQMFSASECVHVFRLAGAAFLRAYEGMHIHTYTVGKKKEGLEVTAIRQQKWVRSEEFCLATISDRTGPNEELLANCPATWTVFIGPVYLPIGIQAGHESY